MTHGDEIFNATKGRVEVKMEGSDYWKGVCDDHFSIKDAHVICRTLTHSSGAIRAYQDSHYGQGLKTDEIAIDGLHCKGSESSIEDCPWHFGNNCSSQAWTGVECISE